MPDWRDESSFDYTRTLGSHGWAWEFLRRNPKYIQFWNEWQSDSKRVYDEFVTAAHKVPGIKRLEALKLPEARPVLELETRYREFGLTQPVDPETPAAAAVDHFARRIDISRITYLGENFTMERWGGKTWPGHPYTLHIAFDLGLPFEPQLRDALADLENCRARAIEEVGLKIVTTSNDSQLRPEEFLKYIRFLDGLREGNSLAELGRVILHDRADSKGSAHQVRNTALKMAQTGYFKLLLNRTLGSQPCWFPTEYRKRDEDCQSRILDEDCQNGIFGEDFVFRILVFRSTTPVPTIGLSPTKATCL